MGSHRKPKTGQKDGARSPGGLTGPEQCRDSPGPVQQPRRECHLCHQGRTSVRQPDPGEIQLQSGALSGETQDSGESVSPLGEGDQEETPAVGSVLLTAVITNSFNRNHI